MWDCLVFDGQVGSTSPNNAHFGEPGHGKDEVDGLNAAEKAHLKEAMAVSVQPGVNDHEGTLHPHLRTGDGEDVSFAEQCIRICGHPDRIHGVKSQGKYQKREASRKITKRVYHLQKRDDVEYLGAKYKAEGFKTIKPDKNSPGGEGGKKYQGISSMYNFVADPDITED